MNVTKAASDPDSLPSSLRPSPPAPKPEPLVVQDRWEKSPENRPVESHFFMDDATHQVVVEVRDVETKEVVREVPSEKMRRLHATLEKIVESKMDVRA